MSSSVVLLLAAEEMNKLCFGSACLDPITSYHGEKENRGRTIVYHAAINTKGSGSSVIASFETKEMIRMENIFQC